MNNITISDYVVSAIILLMIVQNAMKDHHMLMQQIFNIVY